MYMAFDIITVASLVLAFFAGFQKGVLQIFALVLALFAAFLVMSWVLPYLTDFFYASLPFQYHPYYMATVIIMFLLILFISFSTIRILWRREPSDQKVLLQKTLGGFTMTTLMIASISIISVFLIRSEIISDAYMAQSKTVTYLKPVEKWSLDLLNVIDRNARQVKQRNERAKKDQFLSDREG